LTVRTIASELVRRPAGEARANWPCRQQSGGRGNQPTLTLQAIHDRLTSHDWREYGDSVPSIGHFEYFTRDHARQVHAQVLTELPNSHLSRGLHVAHRSTLRAHTTSTGDDDDAFVQ
jgi:hypothetical protein